MRPARVIHDVLLSLGVVLLLVLLVAVGVSQPVSGWLYDRLLFMRPAHAAAKEVLLVDVDDRATAAAGAWPWSREILADGVVLLAEMNARSTVLDLPLGRKSAPALDPSALRQGFPDALDREFSLMEQNIQTLFEAIRRGSVRPKDSSRYVGDLIGLVAQAKLRLLDAATGIERDDDALLGQAVKLSGRAFAPIELLPAADPMTDQDLLRQTLQRLSVTIATPGRDPSLVAHALRPPVLPLLRDTRGGGFIGVPLDRDGVYRRAVLVAKYGDVHIAQIVFAALLDLMGNPGVELRENRIVLHNVALAGGSTTTRVIPLTERGELLIDWPRTAGPRGAPGDGFRHLSWGDLLRHQQLEQSLLTALRDMDAHGYLSYLRSADSPMDSYALAARIRNEMLGAGEGASAADWRAARERFFALADQFLNGDAEARISADAARALQSAAITEQEKSAIQLESERVPGAFAEARQTFSDLQQLRAALHASIGDSLCIVSLAGSQAPTPAGRSPFGAAATQGSAAAALAGTILSGRTLGEIPRRFTVIAAVALALLLVLFLLRARPLVTLLIGIAGAAVCCAGFGAAFVLSGTFLDPFLPCGSAALTGLVLGLDKVLRTRRTSRSLRGAFSGLLSAGGLKKVLSSPDSLTPAGGTRSVTVLSAAVKGLPSAAAIQKPGAVVKLLNSYHAAVAEVILGFEGTLGRGGADAVAAYFGAPLDIPDHARRACRAALRIKAVEKELQALAAPPFATRIGIETGECIVGDIGAGGAPQYSVVGAATDLAARLQSLNARYGTSILVSEGVRAAVGGEFLVRALDRVHIAGTDAIFRVFELVGEKAGAAEATLEALRVFEAGLERFEAREWPRAEGLFARALALRPDDGPTLLYIQRCRERAAGGPPPTAPF
jgi:adenylate cyclase